MKATVLYRTQQAERTRAEILKVAVDIASAEGLEALTIGRLAKELKLSKSGLFAHFGSKEELQLAAVEAAKQIFIEYVVGPSLAVEPGIKRLKAMLEAWLSYVERTVFRGGCFFAAASAEFDSRPGAVRDKIAELTQAWISALADEVNQARRLGQISAGLNPQQLAFELHAFVQEANWAYKLFDDKVSFLRARHAISERMTRAAKSMKNTKGNFHANSSTKR